MNNARRAKINSIHKKLAIYPNGTKLYVPEAKRPYTVRAADSRFVIATKPHFGTVQYFILDIVRNVRGPDNSIFCAGYETWTHCAERLAELQSGEIEVSHRRCVPMVGFAEWSVTRVVLPDGTAGKLPVEFVGPQQ